MAHHLSFAEAHSDYNRNSSPNLGPFLGRAIQLLSQTSSASSISHSDSNDSQATLEDTGIYAQFGHPLQRMFPLENLEEGPFFLGSLSRSSSSSFTSETSWSSTSSAVYDINYEDLVNKLLKDDPTLNVDVISPEMIFVEPSSPQLRDSLMIKCLPRSSPELLLLLEFNHKELRSDPWNPVPHLRCAVERDETVYLCMERLNPYNQPAFKTVANYIDFFRQLLEGITFLHELKVANISLKDPLHYMVDLSSAPSTCLSPQEFDRTTYPVKYYLTSLSDAVKHETYSTSPSSAFGRDVQNCGTMIDSMLIQVPYVKPKLKSLVTAMTTGGFGADESRKLFEALCKSFESFMLDAPVYSAESC